ncbi:MAG TPA: helix-turn-helix transcriptional regulator [Micromonosporaceae bacterium]|nr:helix-turn-helix transcriptional regulator [Micromonosporaceae bacterium]
MKKEQGPTLRAQWLGQQLREMREQASLTLKDVGDYISRTASTVSRIESGILPARVPEVLAYLDICGVDDPHRRDGLRTMAQDVWQRGWWDGLKADVAGSLIDWIWLESRATEIYSFQVSVPSGLLQTRDYAEAVIRAAHPDASEEQIARFVEIRMTRQGRLAEAEPLRLSTVIDEVALHRMIGGPNVVRAQINHLAEMARRPHIDIMVLPADVGAHASPNGSFDVFQMRPPYPYAGCVSTPAGTVVVEGDEAEALVRTYDRLRDAALHKESAVAFLSDLAKRLE